MCFRGGCLTGSNHASAELHGFLAYLASCVLERRPYRIYGYKGKQVSDNIHAADVVRGGPRIRGDTRDGRRLQHRRWPQNSVSILEAIARLEELTGERLESSTSTRRGAETTSVTSAISAALRATIPIGTSGSRSTTSSTISRANSR